MTGSQEEEAGQKHCRVEYRQSHVNMHEELGIEPTTLLMKKNPLILVN